MGDRWNIMFALKPNEGFQVDISQMNGMNS